MSSVLVFFFKQKTAYELRISDWSSDVCSSDLHAVIEQRRALGAGLDEPLRNRSDGQCKAFGIDGRNEPEGVTSHIGRNIAVIRPAPAIDEQVDPFQPEQRDRRVTRSKDDRITARSSGKFADDKRDERRLGGEGSIPALQAPRAMNGQCQRLRFTVKKWQPLHGFRRGSRSLGF